MLAITENGREVMHERARAAWAPGSQSRGGKAEKEPADRARRFSRRRPTVERRPARGAAASGARKSKELGVPPYTIFWDRTLDELCQQRPATANELLSIWGIGEQKQRLFGAESFSS